VDDALFQATAKKINDDCVELLKEEGMVPMTVFIIVEKNKIGIVPVRIMELQTDRSSDELLRELKPVITGSNPQGTITVMETVTFSKHLSNKLREMIAAQIKKDPEAVHGLANQKALLTIAERNDGRSFVWVQEYRKTPLGIEVDKKPEFFKYRKDQVAASTFRFFGPENKEGSFGAFQLPESGKEAQDEGKDS
jgi:hypothetical protein